MRYAILKRYLHHFYLFSYALCLWSVTPLLHAEYRPQYLNGLNWSFNFIPPITLAPLSDGSFWAVSGNNKQIFRFNTKGQKLASLMLPESVQPVSGLDVAPDGNLWVTVKTDSTLNALPYLLQYSAEGLLLKTHHEILSGNNPAAGYVFAQDGKLWAFNSQVIKSDAVTERVEYFLTSFDSNGEPLQKKIQLCDTRSTWCFFSSAIFTIAPDNSVWIVGGGNNSTLLHISESGALLAKLTAPKNSLKAFQRLTHVSRANEGGLWIIDDQIEKQFLHLDQDGGITSSFATKDDLTLIKPASDNSFWAVLGRSNGIFHLSSAGKLLQVFKPFTSFGSLLTKPDNSFWINPSPNQPALGAWHFSSEGALLEFKSLADKFQLTADGSLWASEGRIYSADGNLISTLSYKNANTPGGDSRLNPINAVITAEQHLWVLCHYSKTTLRQIPNFFDPLLFHEGWSVLFHVDATGKIVNTIELKDIMTSNTAARYANTLTLAPDGSLWLDDLNNALIHLNADGSLIATYPNAGGIRFQADGGFWVIDKKEQRLLHVDTQGHVIETLGAKGSSPGQTYEMTSIAIDTDGSIWTADSYNNRLQKFVLKAKSDSPAEYDIQTHLLYLDDVQVSDQRYQVILLEESGVLKVLSVNPANKTYPSASSFNPSTGKVDIPLFHILGKAYRAHLQLIENLSFRIEMLENLN